MLMSGIVLFMFGSGPVRGFAVTLCIGIATSMFTALVGSRALIYLAYGRRRRIERLAI
jgi:preprotein translocase subunit SecD